MLFLSIPFDIFAAVLHIWRLSPSALRNSQHG